MTAGAWTTIYALKDPVTDCVRYIGKANDFPSRMRAHRWEAQSSNLHTHKVRWLRSLASDPGVEVLEVVPRAVWAERERFWIKKFRDAGANLTNIADGGQTSPVEGRGHSASSKAKMSAAQRATGNLPPSRKGIVTSVETKSKLREAMLRNGNRPPPTGGWNKGQRRAKCKNGHELNAETRYHTPGGRYAGCKICRTNSARNYQARQAVRGVL